MASRSLGTLTLDLVARIGGFTSALSKAERDAQARFKSIGNAAEKMGFALGAALAASPAAIALGIKSAIDYADKLNDMNIRLGVSAEALSGWAYAAKQSGTDIDALGIGLKKLAKNMAEALDPKTTQGRLFESLGVSITDAAGRLRSVEDVLPEVASKFKELDNATLESAIAMDLFGKSGTDLLEFLNQGEDGIEQLRDRARELGVELEGHVLQAADQFNDTLADIKTISDGLWAQLAAELLPALIDIAEVLRDGAKQGSAFGSVFDFIAEQSRAAVKDLQFFVQTAKELGALLDGLSKPRGGVYLERYNQIQARKEAAEARAGRDVLAERGVNAGFDFAATPLPATRGSGSLEANLSRAYAPAPKSGGKKKSGGKSDAQREAEQLQAAYDRMNASLAEQVALFGVTGQAGKLRYELENGELAKLTQAQKDSLIAQAEKLDQMERMKEAQDATIEALGREKDAIESVLMDIGDETAALSMSNEQLEIRNRLLRAGVDANSEWGKKIVEQTEALQKLREQTQFVDGVRDSFNDFFMDVFTGTKSIKDAFKDLFDNIAQMITQRIVNGWLDKLFGAPGTSGGGTGGGDLISSLLGFFGFGGANANGNAFSGGNVVPFANGGVVSAPQFFPMSGSRMGLMGEAGPEAIMPLKRGPDGKLGVRMSGGGGIIQNVYVQGRPDKSTLKQMERASGRGAAREMSRTGR